MLYRAFTSWAVILQKIGGLHVRHAEGEGQRILLEGLPHQPLVLVAGEAHVPADGHGLLPGEAQKAGENVHALLPVTVGKIILIEEGGHALPLAVGALYIAGAAPVAADFAYVMEEGDQGNRLRGGLCRGLPVLRHLL